MFVKLLITLCTLVVLTACEGSGNTTSGQPSQLQPVDQFANPENIEASSIDAATSDPEPLLVKSYEGIPYAQLSEIDTSFPEYDSSIDFQHTIDLLNYEFYRVRSVLHSHGAALKTSISAGNKTSDNTYVDAEHQRLQPYFMQCFDSNIAMDTDTLSYTFCGKIYYPVDEGFVLTHIGNPVSKSSLSFTSYNDVGDTVGWIVDVLEDDSLSVSYSPPDSNGGGFTCLANRIATGDYNTKKFCAPILLGTIATLEVIK